MADKVIDIPGVGPIAFPDSMSESDMNAAAAKLYQDHAQPVEPQKPNQPSSSGGLTLAVAGKAVPVLSRAVQEVATNPAVPKLMAKTGSAIGGLAPVVGGAYEAGPAGAAIGLAASAKGSWAGGKTGWFTGKLMQKVAAPIATVATKVEPYAQALSTLSGVQSALDLAQIAEPDRKDIGFLGIGKTQPNDPESEAKIAANNAKAVQYGKDHPAPSLNALADAFASAIAKAPDAWAHIVNDIKQHVGTR